MKKHRAFKALIAAIVVCAVAIPSPALARSEKAKLTGEVLVEALFCTASMVF